MGSFYWMSHVGDQRWRSFCKLLKNAKGATAIEYGLIAALIAVAAIGAMQGIGNKLNTTFNNVSNQPELMLSVEVEEAAVPSGAAAFFVLQTRLSGRRRGCSARRDGRRRRWRIDRRVRRDDIRAAADAVHDVRRHDDVELGLGPGRSLVAEGLADNRDVAEQRDLGLGADRLVLRQAADDERIAVAHGRRSLRLALADRRIALAASRSRSRRLRTRGSTRSRRR